MTEFEELKRNFGEPVSKFIKRFNKLDHKMPPDCKPPVEVVKSRFSKAFNDDFVVMLRERTSRTLEDMQTNAIEVDENRVSLTSLKAKEEKAQRKLKSIQESSSSSSSSKTKTEDFEIDEITSLLRNLSNIISKIETQPRKVKQIVTRPQNQNQGQYKRNPKLQIIQRPSNDQQVPTTLLIDDQQPNENTMTITKDINNMDTSSNQIVMIPLLHQNQVQEDQESSPVSKYHAFSQFLIAELNKRYDLRPRPSLGRPPMETPIIEPRTKAAKTQTTIIQALNESTDIA